MHAMGSPAHRLEEVRASLRTFHREAMRMQWLSAGVVVACSISAAACFYSAFILDELSAGLRTFNALMFLANAHLAWRNWRNATRHWREWTTYKTDMLKRIDATEQVMRECVQLIERANNGEQAKDESNP